MKRGLKRWAAVLRAAFSVLVASLLAAGCAGDGVQVPQSELTGALERKVGLIAFLGIDGNIYTVNQAGANQTALTNDAFSDENGYRIYGMPVWSPDGQSVAFAGYTGLSGQNPTSTSLYTASRDGTSLVQAFTSPHFLVYYAWAPDSNRVGLISQTANDSLAMHVANSDGSPSLLVDAGDPYYWSWSPDGSGVLAHRGGNASNEPANLSLIQFGESVVEQGWDLQPAGFRAPAFSPNGSQALVAGPSPEDRPALLLTDAFGGQPRVLAEYNGNIAFAWSPNGQRVAYLEQSSPFAGIPGKLTLVDVARDAEPVVLTEDEVHAFFWSPDSRSLAYFAEHVYAEDEVVPPAAEANLVLDLKVVDTGNGRARLISTILATERFLGVVPFFDQYHQSLTIWSPDSKNLVMSAYQPDGTPGVWVAAASGRLEPRWVADGFVGFWSRQ